MLIWGTGLTEEIDSPLSGVAGVLASVQAWACGSLLPPAHDAQQWWACNGLHAYGEAYAMPALHLSIFEPTALLGQDSLQGLAISGKLGPALAKS